MKFKKAFPIIKIIDIILNSIICNQCKFRYNIGLQLTEGLWRDFDD